MFYLETLTFGQKSLPDLEELHLDKMFSLKNLTIEDDALPLLSQLSVTSTDCYNL